METLLPPISLHKDKSKNKGFTSLGTQQLNAFPSTAAARASDKVLSANPGFETSHLGDELVPFPSSVTTTEISEQS